MSEPAPTPIPPERLAAARQAMEGEAWRKKRETEAQVLIKRREEAHLAMEGRDRQLKRQAEEAEKLRIKNQAAAIAQAAADKIAAARQVAKSAVESERDKVARAAALEATRRDQAAETAIKIERMKTAPNEMSAVRTFRTDLAGAAAGGASISKSIIQGQKQANQTLAGSNQKSHSGGGWLFLILILLLLGGGALGYVYWMKSTPQTPAGLGQAATSTIPVGLVKPLFIFTDKQNKIELDSLTRSDAVLKLRQAISDGVLVSGQITSLIPTRGGEPLALNLWLTESQITWPEKLTQTLEPKFLIGRYDGPDQATAFLILETKKYEAAFAALQEDESGFVALFYMLTGRDAFSPAPSKPKFTDRLSHNLELRELVKDGQTALFYTFLDQNILVVAEDDAALVEIITRRDTNSR